MNIISSLTDQICSIQKNKPIVIAFDGVDTSGKTTLSNKIYEELITKGKNCVKISIDKFHNSKTIRMMKGELSPEGFFYDSFNIEKIIECVLAPIKSGHGNIINGIYDYKTEMNTDVLQTPVSNNLIVLFDGIFLNRNELYLFWDLSVFLDVSFDTVLKRAIERDKEYFGSVEEVERKYLNRYIPGEKIYLSTCSPKERSDIVIDNNDYENKKILKWNLRRTTD